MKYPMLICCACAAICAAAWPRPVEQLPQTNFEHALAVLHQGDETGLELEVARLQLLSEPRGPGLQWHLWLLARLLVVRHTQSQQAMAAEIANKAWFGRGLRGVESAATGYFGKPSRQLTWSEIALLLAVMDRPNHACDAEKMLRRRNAIARRLFSHGLWANEMAPLHVSPCAVVKPL